MKYSLIFFCIVLAYCGQSFLSPYAGHDLKENSTCIKPCLNGGYCNETTGMCVCTKKCYEDDCSKCKSKFALTSVLIIFPIFLLILVLLYFFGPSTDKIFEKCLTLKRKRRRQSKTQLILSDELNEEE